MRRRWSLAVVLCFLALSGAEAQEPTCDPLAMDLTLTPARTLIYASLKETLRVQASRPERADVVLLGDSLFAGWRTDLPATFPLTMVYDFAVGGDRIPNVLWRLDTTDLAHLSPSTAVLLIGTNDLAAGTPACAIAIGIGKVVERLRALWPDTDVLVLTIPPRGPDFRALDDRRLRVNKAVAELSVRFDRVHAVTIDDNAFTCGRYAVRPLITDTEARRLSCANYADDNLHFSTEGYIQLARILKDTAAKSLGRDVFR